MKTALLFLAMSLIAPQIHSQFVLSDSMDLGEDRLSHDYQEYNPNGGNTVKVGFYDCYGNLGINLGGDNIHDSIVFYLNVVPNVDRVRIHWVFNWYNEMDRMTTMVVENDFENELYGNGQPRIGSDPAGCDKSTHFLDFTGLSDYTADGQIKVKVYDPGVSWGGNCTLGWMEVLSDTSTLTSTDHSSDLTSNIKVYPNPFNNIITVSSPVINDLDVNARLLDMTGKLQEVEIENNGENIRLRSPSLTKGIYFLTLTDRSTDKIVWSQRLIKD